MGSAESPDAVQVLALFHDGWVHELMRDQIPLDRFRDVVLQHPRREGEDVIEWMERIKAAVRPENDRELPTGDREPGGEG
jgi:hypothetical protein